MLSVQTPDCSGGNPLGVGGHSCRRPPRRLPDRIATARAANTVLGCAGLPALRWAGRPDRAKHRITGLIEERQVDRDYERTTTLRPPTDHPDWGLSFAPVKRDGQGGQAELCARRWARSAGHHREQSGGSYVAGAERLAFVG